MPARYFASNSKASDAAASEMEVLVEQARQKSKSYYEAIAQAIKFIDEANALSIAQQPGAAAIKDAPSSGVLEQVGGFFSRSISGLKNAFGGPETEAKEGNEAENGYDGLSAS